MWGNKSLNKELSTSRPHTKVNTFGINTKVNTLWKEKNSIWNKEQFHRANRWATLNEFLKYTMLNKQNIIRSILSSQIWEILVVSRVLLLI